MERFVFSQKKTTEFGLLVQAPSPNFCIHMLARENEEKGMFLIQFISHFETFHLTFDKQMNCLVLLIMLEP